MREKRFLFAGLLIAAVGLSACNYPQPPSSPTTVNVNQNVNVGTPGGPDASPSPGGSVARVGVGKVSETCPVNTAPSGRGDAVKVGCSAFLTCSPYNAQNQELFDLAIIGSAPERFEVVSGQTFVGVVPHGSNPFNLDATGRAAGAALLQCTVKGVTSPPFTLNVVP